VRNGVSRVMSYYAPMASLRVEFRVRQNATIRLTASYPTIEFTRSNVLNLRGRRLERPQPESRRPDPG
jgi:hypothetical protein